MSNTEKERNILKIGMTKHHPEVRANQLSSHAGVLGRFIVEWSSEVPNKNLAEKVLHDAFKDVRIDPKKEYFKISLKEAIERSMYLLKKQFNLEELDIYTANKELKIKTEPKIEINKEIIDVWWNDLSVDWLFVLKEFLPNYLLLSIENYRSEISDENLFEKMTEDEKISVSIKLEIELDLNEPNDSFYENIIEILFELLMTDKNWFCEIIRPNTNKPSYEEIENLWEIETLNITEFVDNFEILEPFQRLSKLEIRSLKIHEMKYLKKLQKLNDLTIHSFRFEEITHYVVYLKQLHLITTTINSFRSLKYIVFKIWVWENFMDKTSEIISFLNKNIGLHNRFVSSQLTLFGEADVTLSYEKLPPQYKSSSD